jgi:hypothetical protein
MLKNSRIVNIYSIALLLITSKVVKVKSFYIKNFKNSIITIKVNFQVFANN